MKMLKIIIPLVAIAALCSFAVSSSSKKELPIDETYKNFINEFKKTELPYSVKFKRHKTISDSEEMKSTSNGNYLGSKYGDIIPDINRGMMSRMGPDDYQAEVLVASNKKFDAVIYSKSPSFRGSHVYYLATFEKNGKMISKIPVASENFSSLEECSISKSLIVNITKFNIERIYHNEEKTSMNYEKLNSKVFRITDNGKIVNTQSDEKTKSSKSDIGMIDLWEY